MDTSSSIATKAVHSGEQTKVHGAVCLPIFQSAMFLTEKTDSYHDVKYIRLNNTPNHLALAEKLAALENAEAAIVTSSGMAAITTSMLSVLPPGGHILAQDCLYGGTHNFLTQDLESMGYHYSFFSLDAPETWDSLVKTNTAAVYVETLANPLLQIGDLEAIAQFARKHQLTTIIDNTFATPVNFNPIDWGFDIVVHSCTKYLNGHSDLVAGCAMGSRTWIDKITHKLNHLGGTLDPHTCFLLQRGIKTLALRVRQQNENALAIAEFLQNHSQVVKVNYPGLSSFPNHKTAKKLLRGYGGMMSFELQGSLKETEAFMKKLRIPLIAPSLGGVETLVTRPATTSHLGMTPEERKKAGISDKLLRLSVGIEDTEDLLKDFAQTLE